MKKIGIVGGVAWQSTVDYYAGLCRLCERWRAEQQSEDVPRTPEMSIESLDQNKAFSLLGRDDDPASWEDFDEYHRAALLRLQASGAEVAAMASNTPHHRFESIVRGIGIPVISILDAAAEEAARLDASRVLILGTAIAMQSNRFREAYAVRGIEAASPRDPALRSAAVELIADFHRGAPGEADQRLARIARVSIDDRFPDGALVSLACTELPLAFPQFADQTAFEYDGLQFINTSAAHIQAIFRAAVS
jgi:aspartate racemase